MIDFFLGCIGSFWFRLVSILASCVFLSFFPVFFFFFLFLPFQILLCLRFSVLWRCTAKFFSTVSFPLLPSRSLLVAWPFCAYRVVRYTIRTVQYVYGTVLDETVRSNAVLYATTVWYGMVQHDTVWNGSV